MTTLPPNADCSHLYLSLGALPSCTGTDFQQLQMRSYSRVAHAWSEWHAVVRRVTTTDVAVRVDDALAVYQVQDVQSFVPQEIVGRLI